MRTLLPRYARQMGLPEITESGQKKIGAAKVLVIGAGGLGSAVLYYLAAAGVGTIGIVDNDLVDLSNLNRQILYAERDVGMQKSACAKNRLHQLNTSCVVEPYDVTFDEQNGKQIIASYDIVIDCVDNIETRYTVGNVCYESEVILIEAGVSGFEGFVLAAVPPTGPCFNCIHPRHETPSAQVVSSGVLGATAGLAGTLQSSYALQCILREMRPDENNYITFDVSTFEFTSRSLKKNPHCTVCGSGVTA